VHWLVDKFKKIPGTLILILISYLGMRFATAQIKAAIVELVSKFNVKINAKTRKDNEFDPVQFISGLQGGIWLDLEKL